MRKLSAITISTIAVIGVLVFTTHLLAARVVVDDIRITQEQECYRVKVSFNFPVQYIKHFPYERGEDLRVQLSPILTGTEERAALFTYEKIQLPYDDTGDLIDVAYEGNVEGGPYLTFYFKEPVNFKVGQGKDIRSLLVAFSPIGAVSLCEINPK